MLRVIVILFGLGLIAWGFMFHGDNGTLSSRIVMICVGALFVAGTIFERRYRPKVTAPGGFEKTGERFIDPTTGKLTDVTYNPQTGEREYTDSP
jgi:hypothetical protein